MKKYLLVLCLLPSLVEAMEEEPLYSYTRIEAAAGSTRHQPGSAQSLAFDGWVGYDKRRLWWQAEGARQAGKTEGSALSAWYGYYFAPFWDAQLGIRHEGNPQSANYLSAGVRGLAPYQFDTDLKLNLRSGGKLSARGRFENELLLTNRFILRPRLDAAVSAANIDATVRSGLYQLGIGLQARYEFSRKFAPYLELSRTVYPRALPGGSAAQTQALAGLWLIF